MGGEGDNMFGEVRYLDISCVGLSVDVISTNKPLLIYLV